MKNLNFQMYLSLIILLISLGCAPVKNSNIILKNGTRLDSIRGTMSNGKFEYRSNDGRIRNILYDSIDFIERRDPYDNELILYRTVQQEGSEDIILLRVLVLGKNIELYASETPTGGQFGGSYYSYWARKDKSKKLKYFGHYGAMNNIADKLKEYFSECYSLSKKIEYKEYRFRSDIIEMFEDYENNCGK